MSEPEETDIHTTAGKIADLQRRIDEAAHAAPRARWRSSTQRAS